MFARSKKCISHKMMIRLNSFLYIFNLRQGAILIAVHQIALSSFILIILLVGISHVGEMLSMLHSDMEDDAERQQYFEIYEEDQHHHHGEVLMTNNQRRFAKAVRLASVAVIFLYTLIPVTVIFLYTSTILTTVYLMCCISLLHGAVKCKRQYVLPWILAACVGVVLLVVAIVCGDGYPYVVSLFGGHDLYFFGCTLIVLTFVYAICAVGSFAAELGGRCSPRGPDERSERLLLLDHAAHSSLLSAAQINKMSNTRSQFV